MARPLRFIPPNSVVEVTVRTIGSRFLLRPGRKVNDIVVGVLGRAQHLSGVRIFALAVMSNHLHALVGVDHAAQLSAFMQHALGNIARKVGRYHRWSGPMWSRRYRSIVVADSESQVNRLRYVLCQGLKEGLVDRVDSWPGVSTFRALVEGIPLRGTWRNEPVGAARGRTHEKVNARGAEQTYELSLSPLPAMADTPLKEYRAFVIDLVREEERAAKFHRTADNKTAVLGVRKVLEQDPHAAPEETKNEPAPLVHAASRAVRFAFMDAYQTFVDAFFAAAASLQKGITAVFPEGAFPPRAPFVAAAP